MYSRKIGKVPCAQIFGDYVVYQDSPISSELPTTRVQGQLFVQSPYTCLEEVVSSSPAPAPANQEQSTREGERDMQTKPSIVFCHGLWADGSCFNKLIVPLLAEGYECIASQHGLNSVAE